MTTDSRIFYVTTPIYYVNSTPHLGHSYTTIVADTLKRFYTRLGYTTFFLTGTDEHGNKVAASAEEAGVEPKEYADNISDIFRSTWQTMDIQNDDFIRTTDPKHIRVVQNILQRVYDKGDIYFGDYGGLYCVGCERFYTEKELADGKCPDHQVAPTFIQEQNYFFKMSKYQDWLISYIKEHPDFIKPERYKNEVLGFLREPLEDLCISRPKSKLSWGIPLPFDDNFVTYVWFDALINYLSGIDYPDGENYKTFWPHTNHLIAKDILKPHAIFWPCMLASADIPLYQTLWVHGYWNVERGKMSKSVGNVVSPLALKDKYGLDAFRYFLLRDMVYGLDSSFSEEALVNRINADLGNDLGNLVLRTLNMIERFCHGVIPPCVDTGENILKETATGAIPGILDGFKDLQFNRALENIWEVIRASNKYIEDTKPWVLAKDPSEAQTLQCVLYNLAESIRIVNVLLQPVLPETHRKIREQFGFDDEAGVPYEQTLRWGRTAPGGKVVKGKPLFPRVIFKGG